MAHEYLKLTYMSCPGAFDVELYDHNIDEWVVAPGPSWEPDIQYRLIPVMPADAHEIIGSMINRGVYLGRLPIKLPERRIRFLGWANCPIVGKVHPWQVNSGPWDGGEGLPAFNLKDNSSQIERPITSDAKHVASHAVISLADPDAHEILVLNEPFWMRKIRGLPGSLKAYRRGRNRYHVEINGECVEIDGNNPRMSAEHRALWRVLTDLDERPA